MDAKKSLICVLVALLGAATVHAQSDFQKIRSRIREDLLRTANNKALVLTVSDLLSKQEVDGHWKAVNYTDTSATLWAPADHLQRVKNLANAFLKEGSPFYGNAALHQAAVTALRFWYARDPKSGNWWHNEIATPQDLGEIIILFADAKTPLPAGLRDSLVQRMKRGNPYQKTGANKLDIAIHYLYRACITESKPLMDSAVEQAFQPIALTTEEGLQHDNSYMQHGPQLQISSYGLVFLSGEYKMAWLLRETAFALRPDKLALLSNYFVNSFLPAIRGRYIDFNTEGRGISRPNILDKRKLGEEGGLLFMAAALDPANRKIIEAAAQRMQEAAPPSYQLQPAHRHFWRADYTQHIRPAYSFNVRTVSDRTKRTESGNRENLLGTFLPDGSTNMQRRGGEYYNILPAWEWDKVPGVTSRDYAADQPMTVQWGESGSTGFVGGISDSLYGATAYTMNYQGVQAKKAWFFFDNEVVCLGAGISSSEKEKVITTLNQCWTKGDVQFLTEGSVQPLSGEQFSGQLGGVWHDSIGYFFPAGQNVTVRNRQQSGQWSRINEKISVPDVSGQVFTLWVDHGAQPQKAAYSYIVAPGIAPAQLKKETVKDLLVLENSEAVQAVWHNTLKLLQTIFYHPASITAGNWTVSIDKPCVLQLRQTGRELVLHLADPSQKEEHITVTVRNASGFSKTIACVLPKGPLAGSTIRLTIQPSSNR